MEGNILVEHGGTIATVVLNRPDKLNALTRSMWVRLGEVFAELDGREDVRCIVLRGAGIKAFAPGNDIAEEHAACHREVAVFPRDRRARRRAR